MRDALVMWKEPRMVVLTAVCSAIFVATLMPFKWLVVFPGLAELRPAAALPIVFSLLFGPAGAWGAAFGNLIGDVLGGMFGPGSIFGFMANFAYGYIPYKLWGALMGSRTVPEELESWRSRLPSWLMKAVGQQGWNVVRRNLPVAAAATVVTAIVLQVAGGVDFTAAAPGGVVGAGGTIARWATILWHGLVYAIIVAMLVFVAVAAAGSLALLIYSPIRIVVVIVFASMACAGILGWGIDMLGFFPFSVFAGWIMANNVIISLLLVPTLLILLYPRAQARYMLYSDLIEIKPASPWRMKTGAIVVMAATATLFLVGVFVSPEMLEQTLGIASSSSRGLAFSPFVAVLIMGLFLL